MLAITPTKLSDFLACPRKYKLKHVEKVPGEGGSSPALAFGISMHRALREIYQANIKDLSFTGALALLEGYWASGAYLDAGQSEEYLIKGAGALVRFCEFYPEAGEQTLGTESYMSCVIKSGGLQIRLGCKADRVSVDAGGVLEIVDYKTNASGAVPTPEALASDIPTFLYYALARITYPEYERIRVSFLNVLTLTKSAVEFTPPLVAAGRARLLELLRTVNRSKFTPQPSESCAWCPFQDICPATGRVVEFEAIY